MMRALRERTYRADPQDRADEQVWDENFRHYGAVAQQLMLSEAVSRVTPGATLVFQPPVSCEEGVVGVRPRDGNSLLLEGADEMAALNKEAASWNVSTPVGNEVF